MSVLAVYDCMLFFMRAARPDRVRETFQLVEAKKVTYCLSAAVLAEIEDVLTRPKHQQTFPSLTQSHVELFLAEIVRQSFFVGDVPEVYVLERDPKDSKYINLAIAAGTPYLITRDNDLLDLMSDRSDGVDFRRRFPSLKIVDPATFIAEIRGA